MSYRHFTEKERTTLMYFLHWKLSYREIGRRLGRHHSTISREVKRNKGYFNYNDYTSELLSKERRHQARHSYKRSNIELYNYVLNGIKNDWSPKTISARMKIDYPYKKSMRISHECIYQWIYENSKQQGELYQHLLRRHKKRRKQRPYKLRGLFSNRVSIRERPISIENRNRFGHWESDSVEGAKGSGGIATHVERKSRLLVAAKLSDKQASTFSQATFKAFSTIPKQWLKTATVDNGKEFAQFKKIEEQTGIKIYFADPYSPWQRGTNENTNGLLRHYFPKGIDWRKVTHKMLAVAVEKLNNRPRKCLNYRTPNEVFFKSINGALTS